MALSREQEQELITELWKLRQYKIDFSDDVWEELERLEKKLGTDKAGVIAKALGAYIFFKDEMENGTKVYIEKPGWLGKKKKEVVSL